jgi:hypothetical protein
MYISALPAHYGQQQYKLYGRNGPLSQTVHAVMETSSLLMMSFEAQCMLDTQQGGSTQKVHPTVEQASGKGKFKCITNGRVS